MKPNIWPNKIKCDSLYQLPENYSPIHKFLKINKCPHELPFFHRNAKRRWDRNVKKYFNDKWLIIEFHWRDSKEVKGKWQPFCGVLRQMSPTAASPVHFTTRTKTTPCSNPWTKRSKSLWATWGKEMHPDTKSQTKNLHQERKLLKTYLFLMWLNLKKYLTAMHIYAIIFSCKRGK